MPTTRSNINKPLLGGHVSVAGGLETCFARAREITAACIQIFGASPRQWNVKMPSGATVAAFAAYWKESRVRTVFLHAPYLINLASPEKEQLEKSIKNLSDNLRIAQTLGADGLIFHIGSGKEMEKEKAFTQVVAAVKTVLKAVSGEGRLVIENAAGGGAKIGARAQEIGDILDAVNSKRMAACFDTAHAFEAGIIEQYTPIATKKLFDEWDKALGCERIVALHINDSKTTFNSHHDRHENIGEGYIGLDGFRALAQERRLWHASWILEVPGFDGAGPDKKNIDTLRRCFS